MEISCAPFPMKDAANAMKPLTKGSLMRERLAPTVPNVTALANSNNLASISTLIAAPSRLLENMPRCGAIHATNLKETRPARQPEGRNVPNAIRDRTAPNSFQRHTIISATFATPKKGLRSRLFPFNVTLKHVSR
jgi:hypothetical protein